MDETLQHDPRTKQQIKDMLYAFLYEPVQRQLQQQLNQLIIRNTVAIGSAHKSFTYKGNFYTCDSTPPPRKLNRLSPLLVPAMDDYLKEVQELNSQEIPYVVGFINQVLNSSNDLCDYLKLLPESVHQPIQKLIATCPCRTKHLTEDKIQEITTKNSQSILMMKQRMAANLLI